MHLHPRAFMSPCRTICRVNTYLEFLETWKCQGIRISSRKSWRRRPKSGKGSGIYVVGGNLIVAAQQNNLPVLYSYCNFIFHTRCSRRIWINKISTFPAMSSRKVGENSGFFYLERCNPEFGTCIWGMMLWSKEDSLLSGVAPTLCF